jgi:hypothetical protein
MISGKYPQICQHQHSPPRYEALVAASQPYPVSASIAPSSGTEITANLKHLAATDPPWIPLADGPQTPSTGTRARRPRTAEAAKRAEAERKAIADAQKVVAVWNARRAGGRELWFYPTIGAAIAAGFP